MAVTQKRGEKIKGNQSSRDGQPHLVAEAKVTAVAVSHWSCISSTAAAAVSLLLVTTASLATRLYNVSFPAHVCWDESHFGKHASYYMNGSFFFDVHPPLGKMLLGAVGYFTGYDGNHSFEKPGVPYGDAEYTGMRAFCAILGALVVPLAFGIVWELTRSVAASTLSSVLVLFETGMLTLSRFILLDPILMFFIMAASFCYMRVRSATFEDGRVSMRWLAWCGLCLACAASVKFVGFFVVLLIGISTAEDLYRLLGVPTVPLRRVVEHLVCGIICLILLPIVVYLSIFAAHFIVLSKSGPGDTFYSSAFQSTLIGNPLHSANLPGYLAYGANATLKSKQTNGGYLHSHAHLYPEELGPAQQQVTTYSHKDFNNDWLIKKSNDDTLPSDAEAVKSGDLIRLEHIRTRRNLHAHDFPAPLSKTHKQVSCYGVNGTGDINDEFRIEVVSNAGEDGRIIPVVTIFRLVHINQRCVLESRNNRLPKSWGFEQGEVTCNPNRKMSDRSLWNIEELTDERVAAIKLKSLRPGFFARLLESHRVMVQGNDNLKPKEEEFHSRPWMWPIDYRGQLFSTRDAHILLLGNPVIFWLNLLVLLCAFIMSMCDAVRQKRQCFISAECQELNARAYGALRWLFIGWLLHYIPFWPMTRVLYFHHYFPASLFSSMLTGVWLQFLVDRCIIAWFPPTRHQSRLLFRIVAYGIVIAQAACSFYLFLPLAYGYAHSAARPNGVMDGLQWLSTWEF